MGKANKISDNARRVLRYCQTHTGDDLTFKDIAEGLGLPPRSVTGVITGLQKRGLLDRIEVEDSKDKLIRCTEEGLAFDVSAA